MDNPMQIPFMYRLVDSGYKRPEQTYTDTIQNESNILEKLDGYVEVKSADDLISGDSIRYIKWDEKKKKERFILGGRVIDVEKDYVMIVGKNGGTFSAQRFSKQGDRKIYETRFFKRLVGDDKVKVEMEEYSKKATGVLKKYGEMIETLKMELGETQQKLVEVMKENEYMKRKMGNRGY
jgi:hypothetical protein